VAEEVPMPRLSDTMEQGTVARWLKAEGDHVAEGDVIAEIDTDKATMELTAFEDGVLLKILVGEGESAELGAPIALIGAEGEEVPTGSEDGARGDGASAAPAEAQGAPAQEAPAEAPPAETEEPAEDAADETAEPAAPAREPEPQPAAPPGDLRASPIARRMAAEAGLDLRQLAGKGSGPDGRIVKVDVERALGEAGAPTEAAPRAAAPPAPAREPAPRAPAQRAPAAEDEVVDATPMLRAVARRMAEAKATVPHFYLNGEIDMTGALVLRGQLNDALAADGEKISVNDLVVRAAALALLENPKFHRSWDDGKLVLHHSAHVGIAVALDDGLIVPVVRSVEQKTVREIARESRDLVERARAGKLKQNEIEGGTFTVSNLGMFGVPSFSAIVNPPEPGILAVGATVKRPVVGDGDAIEVRLMVEVTLSVDHRASSGAEGARLLASIKRLLEQPLLLLA
jgi:pyruvate dehydrogenase E2 component (dihydrolipoamide acetyltransferase)